MTGNLVRRRGVFLAAVVALMAVHGCLANAVQQDHHHHHHRHLRRHLEADEGLINKDEDAVVGPAAPTKEESESKPKPSAKPSPAPGASKAPTTSTVTALSTFIRDMLKFKASKSEEMDFRDHERELQKLRGEYLVIACVGDSLTEGAQTDKRVLSYPAILQEKLTMPPYKVFNFGKGSTTAQSISKSGSAMPYTQSVQYKQSMAAHVDVVVLMLGTNDARKVMLSLSLSLFLSLLPLPHLSLPHLSLPGTNDARKVFWNETRFKSDYTDLIERYQALPSKVRALVDMPVPSVLPAPYPASPAAPAHRVCLHAAARVLHP